MWILKEPFNHKGVIIPAGSPVPALSEEKMKNLIENGVAIEKSAEPQKSTESQGQEQDSNPKSTKAKTKGS